LLNANFRILTWIYPRRSISTLIIVTVVVVGRVIVFVHRIREVVPNTVSRPLNETASLEHHRTSSGPFTGELTRSDDFFSTLGCANDRSFELVSGELEGQDLVAVSKFDGDDTFTRTADKLGFAHREGQGSARFGCNTHLLRCVGDIHRNDRIIVSVWTHVSATIFGGDFSMTRQGESNATPLLGDRNTVRRLRLGFLAFDNFGNWQILR
jgi:hypothetical protein